MRKYLLLTGITLFILSCSVLAQSTPTPTPTATQGSIKLLPSATRPADEVPTPTETLPPSPTSDAPPTLAVENYLNVTQDYSWEVDAMSRITGITISPDKKRIAVFTQRPVDVWWLEMRDTQTGKLYWEVNVGIAKYNALAFSPDASMIATGTGDGLVRIWDTETGDLIRTFEGHTSSSRFIVFSPDANLIASGGSDSTARVWNVANGSRVGIYKIKTNARDIAFSPDSQYLAVTTNYINIYDVLARKKDPIIYLDRESETKNMGEVAFSPNGNVLVGEGTWRDPLTYRWKYRLLVWNFPHGVTTPRNIAIDDAIEDVVIAPDNKVMICLYKDKGRMLLINIDDGEIKEDINIGTKLFLSYSPDISTFAVVSTKTKVTIWNVPKQ